MIISFSGIDSAGKTTQIDLLCDYCIRHNIKIRKVWSKARGTPGVLLLKEIFRQDKKLNAKAKAEYRKNFFKNPIKEKLLYIASMIDLCWYWGIYFRILNVFNEFLICDRYLWDTYVEIIYEFQGIDINKSKLWKLVKYMAPIPKVSFVFIVPAEISLLRDIEKNAAGIETVQIKREKINKYLECINKKCWTNIMDGTKSIMELHKELINVLEMNR